MLTGRPARPQADVGSTVDRGPGRPRRTRYLLCGLLLVPVLIAGGLYLARGPGSSARGAAPRVSPTAPTITLPTPQACGPAGSCVGSPIHAGIARVPASARAGRPGRAHRPARAAPPSASPTSTAPATGRTPAQSASQPGPSVSQQGTPADQVLALINSARSAAGLPPLTVTAGLEASASAHNTLMADGCGLTHQCPGEPAIGARETAAGVDWTAAGENIGEGGPVPDTTAATAQMAVTLTQDMLNEQPPDDGHRLNILSTTFTHIGIAVYRDSSGTVWLTQDFSN
jgi:uncharacterized protein YkwD